MPETNVSFAKIVANPSEYSWSQAYNAGKLFAVLSLEKNQDDLEEKDVLNLLGKEILHNLEQEYYTLETKDLDSIKNAVLVTAKKIPDEVFCSFVICAIVNNLLYVFILGKGKVDIKRGEKLGTILAVDEGESSSVKASSGFLQNEDLIILQTKQFSDIVSHQVLTMSLDNQSPNEIAEILAPKIHGHSADQSGASAIIVLYKGMEKTEEILEPTLENEKEELVENESEKLEKSYETTDDEIPLAPVEISSSKGLFKFSNPLSLILGKIKIGKLNGFSHSKKLILTIVVIIAFIFAVTVFLAIKKQNEEKTLALFNQVYPQAQKKYDEGQSLLGLNQNLAYDSFLASQKILEEGKSKFSEKSKEEKQILDLLSKVKTALSASSGISSVNATIVENKVSNLLSAEIKFNASYATQDDKNIYFVDTNGVSSVEKSKENSKILIKPSELPKNIGGLGIYFGNIYVLDKDGKQINKFVQTSGGFSKADYFTTISPDLSDATSIAIDGSIWILFKNGTIEKFTKGKSDEFALSGLTKAFSNPLRIATATDFSNIYVLDSGNSRIVVFDKNGSYKAQYNSDVIRNAKDFEVLETDKKIYVLSQNKVYQIDLK